MKLKSHSGLKKRVKRSAGGKFIFQKPCKNHLLINKNKRQKALAPRGVLANASDVKKLRRLLPII